MALIVRVDSESVPTVKFSKGEELPKLLFEVPILKTRAASAVQIGSSSKCFFKSNIQLSVNSNSSFISFTSLRSVIGPENPRLSLNQSDAKLKETSA